MKRQLKDSGSSECLRKINTPITSAQLTRSITIRGKADAEGKLTTITIKFSVVEELS